MFHNMNYIYTVYQERSFSRAAEKLYISQSSLSLTIKKAEERIGAQIFDRKTNPLTLTEFGKSYISAIEKIRKLQDDLENQIYEEANLKKGHVSIAAANFCATYLLPPVISACRTMYPGIQIDLFEGNTAALVKMLSSGQIDLLVSNMTLDEHNYQSVPFMQEHLILAIPKSICAELPSDLSSLSGLPFILLRPGNDTRTRADNLCAKYGIHPDIVLELDQMSTSYHLSCSGMGATIVSDLLIRKSDPVSDMHFCSLEGDCARRAIRIHTRKNHSPTKAMEAFLEIASQNYQ